MCIYVCVAHAIPNQSHFSIYFFLPVVRLIIVIDCKFEGIQNHLRQEFSNVFIGVQIKKKTKRPMGHQHDRDFCSVASNIGSLSTCRHRDHCRRDRQLMTNARQDRRLALPLDTCNASVHTLYTLYNYY